MTYLELLGTKSESKNIMKAKALFHNGYIV